MSNEHHTIRDAIGHQIMLWANKHNINMKILHTSHGPPQWDFRTTGKRGGSPNICLTRPVIFCHNGTFTLQYMNKTTHYELANPNFPTNLQKDLATILRIPWPTTNPTNPKTTQNPKTTHENQTENHGNT